ncbi:uncharacterized protein LOC105680586 [Bombus impatiens]|uniref:Uncharacterized protein LOC105680586 n=1 Tax=Bombus impatiens TaxID=132113 RepID=A0A6P8L3I3_BOMIM|nr:uncharacterized protein LOC105680586 [Bombus impatiens]
MATPRKDTIETVGAALTSSEIDPTIRAILDAMQKQHEALSQQISILTRRIDEIQRANEENKKLVAEIALVGESLARIHMENVSETSSLITSDETTHTARDQLALRGLPPIPQIPPQLSEDRAFTQRFAQPELKAKDALRCIPQLNGEDDIGVEEFIKEVGEMRAMCSEQYLLLKMIKIDKISGKAAMAIRNIRISEYADLYQALRQNVATETSIREHQDQLRKIRQGFNESVQSYIIRFRKPFSELQYSIANEYPDEITRRAMSDIIQKDSVTDFIQGLKTEIGLVLVANPPCNVIEAEKRAAEIERYFRERRTRKQH